MPTTPSGSDLYAAYARQLNHSTDAHSLVGGELGLPGDVLLVFDPAAHVSLGHLTGDNGYWKNAASGFAGVVVVSAGKATIVFRNVAVDDKQFWGVGAGEGDTQWSSSDLAGERDNHRNALLEDALTLTRAVIAQFGAANVTVDGAAAGSDVAAQVVGAQGVEGYTFDTHGSSIARIRAALFLAAEALHLDMSNPDVLTALGAAALRLAATSGSNEPAEQASGLTPLSGTLGTAHVTAADFLTSYQSALAAYDTNTQAHLHNSPQTGTETSRQNEEHTDPVTGTGTRASNDSLTGAADNDGEVQDDGQSAGRSAGSTDTPRVAPNDTARTVETRRVDSSQSGGSGLDIYAHAPAGFTGNMTHFDPGDAARAATAAADYFVYMSNGAGNNEISNFTAGSAVGHDIIEFSNSVFADWAHLLAASSQVGADTIITVDSDSTITLKGVTLTSLTADDFNIV